MTKDEIDVVGTLWSDDERIGKFVDCFLEGRRPREEDDDLAIVVCKIYAASAVRGRKRLALRCKMVKGKEKKAELLDVVMEYAYPSEELDISVARVGKAAAMIGFKTLNAFTAYCAYRAFPELTERPMK